MDLRVQHHCTLVAGSDGPGRSLIDVAAMHLSLLHWQAEISRNPHTPAMPLAWHCACTAAGSVGLSLLTQAGIAPQQLPTSLTAQSALVLQLKSTVAAFGTTRGGKGVDFGGAVGSDEETGGAGVFPARSLVAGGVGAGAAHAASENARTREVINEAKQRMACSPKKSLKNDRHPRESGDPATSTLQAEVTGLTNFAVENHFRFRGNDDPVIVARYPFVIRDCFSYQPFAAHVSRKVTLRLNTGASARWSRRSATK